MKRTDPVYFRSQVVGTAETEKQGLYYRFKCICRFPRPGMYTVNATSGNHTQSLGICVPDGPDFVLVTRIPVKRFTEEDIMFTAAQKNEAEQFIPVCDERPFPYIAQLEQASFIVENNTYGIILHRDNCYPAAEDSAYP